MHTRWFWRALSWLLASAALFVFSQAAVLRTPVIIVAEPEGVSISAAGTTIEASLPIMDISSIQIIVGNSIQPTRLDSVHASTNAGPLFAVQPDHQPPFPKTAYPPVGDWYVDRKASLTTAFYREFQPTEHLIVEATFSGRSLVSNSCILRGDSRVSFHLRRGLINNDLMIIDRHGRTIANAALAPRIGDRMLASSGLLGLGVATSCLLIGLFGLLKPIRLLVLPPFDSRRAVISAIIALALIFGLSSIMIASVVFEKLPHQPDSVAYLLQARWLADGHIDSAASTLQEHLPVPFTFVHHGRWIVQYPIGWSILMAGGAVFGLEWIVSPLLGFLYPVLIFLAGRELHDSVTGLAASILAVVSPMASLMYSCHLSHGASALFVLGFLWLISRGRRTISGGLGLAAGVLIGTAFCIRPLTAVAIALPFAFVLINDVRRSSRKKPVLRFIATVNLGGVLGILPVVIANTLLTGRPWTFPYSLLQDGIYSFDHLADGIRNMDTLIAHMLPSLFGWAWPVAPSIIVYSLAGAFIGIPFLLRRADGRDFILLSLVLALMIAHLATSWNGLHGFGARYYFEIYACLYLLCARGFIVLAEMARSNRQGVTALASFMLFIGLNLQALAAKPERMMLYSGYNNIDGRLERSLSDRGIDRALVIFASQRWYDWGRSARLATPGVDEGLVFATSSGNDSQLLAAYPDRPVYRWVRNQLVLIRESGPS